MANPIRNEDLVQSGNPFAEATRGVNDYIIHLEQLEQVQKDIAAQAAKQAGGVTLVGDNAKIAEQVQLLNELQGKYSKVKTEINAVSTAKAKAREEQKKLSALEKEDIRLKKQLIQAEAKLKKSVSNRGVELEKIRIIQQKQNRLTKEQIKIDQSAAGSIERLRLTTTQLIRKRDELGAITGRNRKRFDELTAAIKRNNTSLLQHDKSIGRSQRNVGNYGSALGNIKGQLLGITAGFLGVMGVMRLFRNMIGIVTEFENEMLKVRAITGATEAEFERLQKRAKALGGSTIFTASQVAQLEVNLGKLGFTTSETLAAVDAITQLAAATGEDLAESAAVAGATVRGFGLDAIETQRVVDVMARSFTSSALDLEKFKIAMSKVAPVAKTFGFTIEDTTALLAKLSDAGFEASVAGTSTRNILLNLADANGKLAKALGGSVNSFDELIPALVTLREQGVDLNDTLKLTDKRSVAAFNRFLDGAESALVLRDSLNEASGAAKEMADIQLESLKNKTLIAKSAWEGFVISLDESSGIFSRVVKGMVEDFTDVVNAMTDINELQEVNVSGMEKLLLISEKVSTILGNTAAAAQTKKQRENLFGAIITVEERVDIATKRFKFLYTEINKGNAAASKEFSILADRFRNAFGEESLNDLITNLKRQAGIVDEVVEEVGESELLLRELTISQLTALNTDAAKKEIARRKKAGAEMLKADKEISNLLIKQQFEGVDKEIAKENLKFARLKASLEKHNLSTELATAQHIVKVIQIREKANDKLEAIEEKGRKSLFKSLTEDLGAELELEKAQLSQKLLLDEAEFVSTERTEKEITAFRKEQNKEREIAELELAVRRLEIQRDLADDLGVIDTAIFNTQIENLKTQIKILQDTAANLVTTKKGGFNFFRDILGIDPNSEEGKKDIDALKSLTRTVANELQKVTDAKIQAADNRKALADRELDEKEAELDRETIREAAGLANFANLRRQEVEEAKILQDRANRDAAKAQKEAQAINDLAQISAILTAAANAYQNWSTIPFVGQVAAVLEIGAMIAGFAFVKKEANSIVTAYDGIEDTGPGGKEDSRGGMKAVVHPHERIVKRSINEQLGGFPSKKLPTAVQFYKNSVAGLTGAENAAFLGGVTPQKELSMLSASEFTPRELVELNTNIKKLVSIQENTTTTKDLGDHIETVEKSGVLTTITKRKK